MPMILRIAKCSGLSALLVAVAVAQPPGSESVRFESSWSRFRTAAADLLGWKVAAAGEPKAVDAAGLMFIELRADPLAGTKTRLRALNLKPALWRVKTADRATFVTAKELGVETIALDTVSGDLAAVDKLANELD